MNAIQGTFGCPPVSDIEGANRRRKWFLALGIVTIIFGLAAIIMPVVTAFAAILLLGSFLLLDGIFQIIHTLRARRRRHFFIHLVISVLYIITGILLVVNPSVGAASLALLMASFFVAAGIFRIIGSMAMRFRDWGWILFNGIVDLVLGILIFASWPVSGLWVIGLFVGIEMMIYGRTLVMFSAAEREEIRQFRLECQPAV